MNAPRLRVHPFANLFPYLEGDDLDDLTEDIRVHGQREPAAVFVDEDGTRWLVDGRNRSVACQALGVELVTEEFDEWTETELLDFVLSKNLHRRHLSVSQRAVIAIRAQKVIGSANLRGKASEIAAKALGVSARSVEHAAHVERVAPELTPKVSDGTITVSAASELADEPEEVRDTFLAKLQDAEDPKAAAKKLLREERLRKRDEKRAAEREAEIAAAEKAAEGRDPIENVSLYLGDVENLLASMMCKKDGPELITADPPWKYSNTGTNGAVGDRYDGLPTAVIVEQVAFAHGVAADNAYLALWITKPFLEDWFKATAKMADMWRWRFVTGMSWGKRDPEGEEAGTRIGAGFHVRGDVEDVLVYVKGRPPRPREALSNWWVSDRIAHSEKPMDMQRAMVRAWTAPGGEGGVLDMYSGRFPMGRACLAEGRRCRGAEISKERHDEAMALLRGRVGL